MSFVVGQGVGLSLTTGTVSADQISGTYQFPGAGTFTFAALGSATGMKATVIIGGTTVMNDMDIPWFGTSGTMKRLDNQIFSQYLPGGRAEVKFRNPTGGTLTVDWMLLWDPLPVVARAARAVSNLFR